MTFVFPGKAGVRNELGISESWSNQDPGRDGMPLNEDFDLPENFLGNYFP
jgi:hypothetical protein